MPSSKVLNNLMINKLTEAQYDAAVLNGDIGEDDLSLLIDAEDKAVQVDTMPTASASEVGNIYQYVGTTDANYTNGYFYKCVSDGQNPATYSWSRVDVQPTPVIPDPLPSQTGNAGKFLTTDGTDASWGNALVNNATGNNALSILGNAGTYQYGVNIGSNSTITGGSGIAIGRGTSGGEYGIGIGRDCTANNGSIAMGWESNASRYSVAIGGKATSSPWGCIQIGSGTNSTDQTVQFYRYRILEADGTIPADRLTHAINKYSTMPTAASTNEGWIVQFTGTTDSIYTHGYIYECKAQGTDPETYAWTPVDVQPSDGQVIQYTEMPLADSSMSQRIVQYVGYLNPFYVRGYFYFPTGSIQQSDSIVGVAESDTISRVDVDIVDFKNYVNPPSDRETIVSFICTDSEDPEVWEDASGGGEVSLSDYGIVYSGTVSDYDMIYVKYTPAGGRTWTQTDVQPAPVIPDPLPSQTGNAGKFLTTDGTDASWSNKVLTNQTTVARSIAVGPAQNSSDGEALCVGNFNVAIGDTSMAVGGDDVSIGSGTQVGYSGFGTTNVSYGVGVGSSTTVNANYGIGIGYSTYVGGIGAIQLGSRGGNGNAVNQDANTFKVANANGNFEIMSADGTIPTGRLTTLLEALYPVGSVYLGTQSTCPLATLLPNSTWALVASDKALWTGDGTNGNTTIAAALPNIKGLLTVQDGAGASKKWAPGCTVSGAFTKENVARDAAVTGGATSYNDAFDLGINAHESNSIYDDNATTVQPPAYVVNVWRRTA